jgi:hypothetical protein
MHVGGVTVHPTSTHGGRMSSVALPGTLLVWRWREPRRVMVKRVNGVVITSVA